MANTQLVHSHRIGTKTVPLTLTEDGLGCYSWTKRGRTVTLADGSEQVYLNCSGCRAVVDKKGAKKQPIKRLKFNLTTKQFTDSVESYNYLAKCVPKVLSQVKGVNLRRSIQAEMATGIKEKPPTARARIDNRVLAAYGRDNNFATIRSAVCGNVRATQEGLARAKRKKFPNIRTYKELLAKENQAMHFTLQGMNAKFGDEHFEEKLLLYGVLSCFFFDFYFKKLLDEDLLLFGSLGQLNLLRNCDNIICDGWLLIWRREGWCATTHCMATARST
uniref:Uncharacterized protein n=1 Tax=Ditylenchus dipsaci TaxID=166011 RepID=A0A915D4Y8_9BILA